MTTDQRTEEQVIEVVKAVLDAYSAMDLDGVLDRYLSDPGMVVVGARPGMEFFGGEALREALLSDFDNPHHAGLKASRFRVSVCTGVAYVFARVNAFSGPDGMTISGGRLTAVLKKQQERWLIAQSHLSFPRHRKENGTEANGF
ncbi:MAG: nuclear transport factor 2 family protein [Thermodesulfobacteriota bacterium]